MKHPISTFLFIITILLVSPLSLVAQYDATEDKVIMKDGTEYRGDIAMQIPDSIVVLSMVGGSKLILAQHEIESITYGQHRYKKIKYFINRNRKPLMVRNRGLASHMSFQFYPRSNEWGGTSLNAGLYYSLNYRLSHQLGIGGGLGIESYEGGAGMPAFLNISGDLTQAHVTPTYFVRTGYTFGVAPSWRNLDFQGGWMNEVGIGVKYRTRSKLEWVTGIGFRRQPVRETTNPGWWWGGGEPPQTQVIERVYNSLFLHYTVYF